MLQTITTVEEATAFEAEGEAVVIGLFSKPDSEQAKAFMSAASGIDRLPFAISSTKEVRNCYVGTDHSYKYPVFLGGCRYMTLTAVARVFWCFGVFIFTFYFLASEQAVVTGVPAPPRFLPSIFIAHRVQQFHCSSVDNLSSVASSRSRAFRKSVCAQEKSPTNLYEYELGGTRTHETDLYPGSRIMKPDTTLGRDRCV